MAYKIKAVLTKGQEEQLHAMQSEYASQDVKNILRTVQHIVDENIVSLHFDQLNFIPVQAIPNKKESVMELTTLLVNLTYETHTTLSGEMDITISERNLNLSPLIWNLDAEFLGDWQPNEAILVTQNVPYTGRPTKRQYILDDIQLNLKEFKSIKQ